MILHLIRRCLTKQSQQISHITLPMVVSGKEVLRIWCWPVRSCTNHRNRRSSYNKKIHINFIDKGKTILEVTLKKKKRYWAILTNYRNELLWQNFEVSPLNTNLFVRKLCLFEGLLAIPQLQNMTSDIEVVKYCPI